MGKSPGKWIKTVLFRKKSSKSNISKAREKLVTQKESPVAPKASETEFSFNPTPITFPRNERDAELENKDLEHLLLQNQADISGSDHQDAPLDLDRIMQEEATTKVQATCRGYLARRAFMTLKGIIRLQALIRGHLVRRQAISTLCCMYGTIKIQALVRGRRVRQSEVGYDMHGKCNVVKHQVDKCGNSVGLTAKIANMSANSFIRKLLASSTATTALHLQYPSGDPNAVLSWLVRWSASHFWKPVPKPKKRLDSKSQRKIGNISNGDAQTSKPKRSNWKIPSSSSDLVLVQESSDFEKLKRNLGKVSSKPTDTVEENSEYEFEKVKRNLRKVHNPVAENSAQPEVESKTVKQHSEKASVTSGYDVEEEVKTSYNEKIKIDSTLTMSNEPDGDGKLRISVGKKASNMLNTQVPTDSVPLRENTSRSKNNSGEEATKELKDSQEIWNDEHSPLTNGHLSLKEDLTRNENQKPGRKSPVLAKQKLVVEDGSQNSPSPTLPSYMAATESAKAKLRAQGSPRLGQDSGGERSNLTRRHSLPSLNNGKISSHSPRTHRPAQAGGKKGHRSGKTNKTMGSSTDGKSTQAEWRR
ncbi:hypothetical protein QN277_025426 [Acacia crassicarpa]|uniref:DUF4005 domain-containing protein n=1 Tax=Acacia crassicarpa TaxID=499986 RepID=A0AAE1MEA5_9FABA|nr:hypothetical protein QN277_025426 [Acacia crassicarpa]